jgi:hypothetical protein
MPDKWQASPGAELIDAVAASDKPRGRSHNRRGNRDRTTTLHQLVEYAGLDQDEQPPWREWIAKQREAMGG